MLKKFLTVIYGNNLMPVTVLTRKKLNFEKKNFGYWHDTTNLQNKLIIIVFIRHHTHL